MKSLLLLIVYLFAIIACQQKTIKNLEITDVFYQAPRLQSSMQNLKENIVKLQPYIFNKVLFNNVDNFEFLSKEIHKLATESVEVKHDPSILNKDPTVKFIASQFADELQRADINFKRGLTDYSRSQLKKMSSYCLECHIRLQDGRSFKPDEVEPPFIKTLPAIDQIEFKIAFRQFDSAYDLVLQMLLDSKKSYFIDDKIDQIARLGLLVSVQYMKDQKKAKNITFAIKSNPKLPTYLKQSNLLWQKSIQIWNTSKNIKSLLEIRTLVKQRISEIEDMRALSSLLALLTTDLNQDQLGEALLLTGQSYESLNKISSMNLNENYYESCIIKAPETKWAKICFDKLSESVVLSYSGSSGTHLSDDIKIYLKDLKQKLTK